jgi:hypothetical protein
MRRGYIWPQDSACLTAPVWTVLKSMRKLKELCINFSGCDPYIYERVNTRAQTLPAHEQPQFLLPQDALIDPVKDGLRGFTHLEKLKIWGIGCDRRLNDIAQVVFDCVASGTLRSLRVGIESWMFLNLIAHHQNMKQDLLLCCEHFWGKCFHRVRTNIPTIQRMKSPPSLSVIIHFHNVVWTFGTAADYAFRPELLTELRIHEGLDGTVVKALLKRLSGTNIPNLRRLLVTCYLKDILPLLKSFSGLQELYILNPISEERRQAQASRMFHKERRVAYETCQVQPNIRRSNLVMDVIAKCHLRSLEVLVIDEMVAIPWMWEYSGTINSLSLWKERGINLKQLGIALWGPIEHITRFITCFPRLKCLHLFNSPHLEVVSPIREAPICFQQTSSDIFFQTPYLCNAANIASQIAAVWANELINGKGQHVLDSGVEATRWIAVGPYYITEDNRLRWQWREDNARQYLEWKLRLSYVNPGTFFRMWARLESQALGIS